MKEIRIPISSCENLEGISTYNRNYYKLPCGIKIIGFGIVLEICEEDNNSYEYVLGNESQGKFEFGKENPKFSVNYGRDTLDDLLIINLDNQFRSRRNF